tara:strand:+ start:231 stop:431 length:201 start_codon:yes stop_codon:yes gene_type:complete
MKTLTLGERHCAGQSAVRRWGPNEVPLWVHHLVTHSGLNGEQSADPNVYQGLCQRHTPTQQHLSGY